MNANDTDKEWGSKDHSMFLHLMADPAVTFGLSFLPGFIGFCGDFGGAPK
jgi:hypothetical protein